MKRARAAGFQKAKRSRELASAAFGLISADLLNRNASAASLRLF
jgi:hypothetical protein